MGWSFKSAARRESGESFFNLLGEGLHSGDIDDAFAAAPHGDGLVLNFDEITGGEPFVFAGLPGDEIGIEHAGAFEEKFSVLLLRFLAGKGLAEGGGLLAGLVEIDNREADFDDAEGLGEEELGAAFFGGLVDFFRVVGFLEDGGDAVVEIEAIWETDSDTRDTFFRECGRITKSLRDGIDRREEIIEGDLKVV